MKIENLTVLDIQKCMKNRYPFFLLDKITEVECGQWSKGYKNFSINEYFFQGHFADDPNVPGAIQLEVMIETFLMTFLTIPEYQGMETADSMVDKLRFLRKIVPGDRLEVTAVLESIRRGIAKGRAEGTVNGQPACSCELTVCIPEIMNQFLPGINR